MRSRIAFKATGMFLSAVAVAVLLSSCRTVPSNPEEMTCADLDYLAAESLKKNKYPFFVSQLSHPGDWRVYSFTDNQVNWIKNDSRRRMRESKKDWVEVEVLRLDPASGTQEHMKVRTLFENCRKPSAVHAMQLVFIPQQLHEKSGKTTAKVDMKGTTANDRLARLVCGQEDYPEKNKYEVMAQKWKECQMPAGSKTTSGKSR